MTPVEFAELMARVTAPLAGRALDPSLEADLNRTLPAGGDAFQAVLAACRAGTAAGWMCGREAGGIRFGRVVKPGAATQGFSVDVVDMAEVAGPQHRHPNGEIDLIMPISGAATFDGRGAGWLVYGPGTAHRPTVRGGEAFVLYMLPGGAIEFTKEAQP
jgi:hypothetical protein